jgi:hypothetical protein
MSRLLTFILLAIVCGSFTLEDDFISEVKKRSSAYFAKNERMKLELSMNQEKYIPGDTAYVRTLYIKASDLTPVEGKEIVNIYLFDRFGKKAMSRWALLDGGKGSNKMVFPKDISPGNYLLVAYTEWMKNFDQSLYYKQEITVAAAKNIVPTALKDSIAFFAEGGHLVAGVESNLAIRYTGKEKKLTAHIKHSGTTIASLELTKDSIATYRFVPELNAGYYVEAQTENGIKKFTFPAVKADGISIIADASSGRVKLKLACAAQDKSKSTLHFMIYNNNGLAFAAPLDFSSNASIDLMVPQKLHHGVAQVVVVDSRYNLLASRVIFIGEHPNNVVRMDSLSDAYATRQLVKFDLSLKDADGYSRAGTYSCMVINDHMFPQPNNAVDYITFRSDISDSFNLVDKTPTTASLNNYLITQTCPWFDWNKIVNNAQPKFGHKYYQTLSGQAFYEKNNLPVKDSTLLMFFLENKMKGYEVLTNKNGRFSFLLPNIESEDMFFFSSTYKGNDTDDISVKFDDQDSAISFTPRSWTIDTDADPYFNFASKKRTIDDSYSFFTTQNVLYDTAMEISKAFEDELNGADITLNLSDYVVFPTMEDVVREILKAVSYRKSNGKASVHVAMIGKQTYDTRSPLFVIDGKLTRNPAHFLDLKPIDVVSIKVVKTSSKLFALGQLGINGVILVKTKRAADFKEKNRIKFSGLLPRYDFVKGKRDAKVPDIRSCLFWKPNAFCSSASKTTISFFTSDDVGRFRIVIKGLSEDGIPFYSERPFEVRYLKN